MNKERIQKLIEQTTTIEEHGWGASYEHFDKQKFAELIVGHAIECVRDVLRDENSDLSYAGASQVQKRLREFFGVEE